MDKNTAVNGQYTSFAHPRHPRSFSRSSDGLQAAVAGFPHLGSQPTLPHPGQQRTFASSSHTHIGKSRCLMLHTLGIDTGLYSLHSLCRGGATAAYQAGADQLDIKCHGTWLSDAFWGYITAPSVAMLPVASALAAVTTAL